MTRLALFIFSILIWTSSSAQETVTLENLWQNYSYFAKSVPGFNFTLDGKHYTRLEDNKINKYDLTTGNLVEMLLDASQLVNDHFNGEISDYYFNHDESKIILSSQREYIYRRSSKAFYFIYDISSKQISEVLDQKIMYASLNKSGDKVAYVLNNNIHIFDLNSKTTEAVTNDGKTNEIINGAADWVYEEEFAMSKAFAWSPNGDKIAFMRFDEREVPEFTMTLYHDQMYPTYSTFKYPKVGEKNAKVSALVYDVNKKSTEHLDMGNMDDKYIPRIKWTTSNDELVVFKMNRHQNNLQLHLFNFKSNESKILLEEKNKYYIDITDDLTFLKDGKRFIWTSEKDGYNQIFLYNKSGNQIRKLTGGNFDVSKFYGVDEKNQTIYYASKEISPLENHIYAIGLDGKNKTKLSSKPGNNKAQFSSTYDYFVLNHSNVTTPPNYTVFDRKNTQVRIIEDNKAFQNHTEKYGLNPMEFFTFKTSEDVELNAYMIKPPGFNPNRSYPVFMTQYSGPGSQSVTNSWGGANYWWYQILAQEGYLVVCVDPRGTGGRGEEFKKMTYLQLGKYETIDQIEAGKYLASLPYVDASRIGIFGWSYGGYMSTLCLSKGADVFKAAIAVAPVTNWKWYDSIYTERYMRTYKENEAGFRENSPIYFADKIKGNYLLVHGLADDNVHWQNSAEMTRALVNANVQFDTYVYPNKNHGIYGGNTRYHLFTKMTNFVKEKL